MTNNIPTIIWKSSLFRFILIGGLNWLLFNLIQLYTYFSFGFGYWPASFTAFVLTGIEGYFISRTFVFRSNTGLVNGLAKYISVLGLSYLISFSTSRFICPVLILLLNVKLEHSSLDTISMVSGSILAAVTNYIGQRYLTFKRTGVN